MVDLCSSLGLPEPSRSLVRLYLLRILAKLGGHRYVMDERRVIDPDLFQDLGIDPPPPKVPYRPDLLVIKMRRRLLDLERKELVVPADTTLTRNLRWLAESLELSPLEADIAQFLAIVHHISTLRVIRSSRLHPKIGTVMPMMAEPGSEPSS